VQSEAEVNLCDHPSDSNHALCCLTWCHFCQIILCSFLYNLLLHNLLFTYKKLPLVQIKTESFEPLWKERDCTSDYCFSCILSELTSLHFLNLLRFSGYALACTEMQFTCFKMTMRWNSSFSKVALYGVSVLA
jgi:hypothetical protein